MAKETEKNVTVEEAEKKQTGTQKTEQKVLSVYSVSDLAANARKIFNTRQECVVAALRIDGKSEYTVSEAKEIVEKFLKKEVE